MVALRVVGQATSASVGGAGDATLTLPALPTVGNLLVVTAGDLISADAGITVTDNQGNTFSLAVRGTDAVTVTCGIWYLVVPAGLSGTYTVTVHTTAGGGTFISADIQEYAAIGTPTLDKTATNFGTGVTTADSGTTASVAVAGEVVVAAMYDDNSANPSTVTTGVTGTPAWTERAKQTNGSSFGVWGAADRLPTSAAAEHETWTVTSSRYAGCVATFQGLTAPNPAFVAAGTADQTATSGTALAPGLPAGWAADDIHVLVAHNSGNVAFNTPTGWTAFTPGGVAENNTTAQRVQAFWRRAVAGDTAPSVAMASAVTTVRMARIFGIRGCPTTGDPFDVSNRSNNAAAATITFPALTTVTDKCLLLAVGAYEDDPTTYTTPTNFTQPSGAASTSSLGNDCAMVFFYRPSFPSGTQASVTTTVSGGTFANSVNVGLLLALKPILATSLPPFSRPHRFFRRVA